MATRRPGTAATASPYRVRGLIVHLGDDLPPRQRARTRQTLRDEVPQLAALVDARALDRARPLGAGAADILIPLPRAAQTYDVRQAWDAVHALRRHRLVADAEPAVRTQSGVAPPPGRRLGAVGGPEGPPLPQAQRRRWSVDHARLRGVWPEPRGRGRPSFKCWGRGTNARLQRR